MNLQEKKRVLGYVNSPETREKMRLAKLGKRGSDTNHYGKPHSEVTRQLIKDRIKGKTGNFTGKKHSDATKLKISQSRTGKGVGVKNAKWRGGVTSSDRIARVMFRKQIQQKVFQRDNYTCQICDQYGASLQVDHIKSWKDYPELRFEESNCRTLCMACHYYVTFKKKLPQGVIWGHNLSRRIVS